MRDGFLFVTSIRALHPYDPNYRHHCQLSIVVIVIGSQVIRIAFPLRVEGKIAMSTLFINSQVSLKVVLLIKNERFLLI